jgi:hypothetical protein
LTAELGSGASEGPGGSGEPDEPSSRELRIRLDPFTHEVLEQEAARMDSSVEEFVRFAAVYYLADLDSGRIARHLPSSPPAARPDPLGRPLE